MRATTLAAALGVPLAAFGIVRLIPGPLPQGYVLESRDARLAATVRLPEDRRPPYPAAVLVHGSGRVTAQQMLNGAGRRFLALGVAVLAYDKRGVGASTGDYTNIGPANSERMFDLLAADALAGVAVLKARRDIDATRIGLVGISQGGWIAPLAASRSGDVAFVVSISGPAVSVGEEIAYSRLAGEDPDSQQGLSDEEIESRMKRFSGPHGYDPLDVLRRMRAPSLWILGEKDRSIPVRRTLDILAQLESRDGRPITTHVIPGVNHGLRNASTGAQPDFWVAIAEWLARHGLTRR
jgi:uncharacterized protein